jgi:hypothetical protein
MKKITSLDQLDIPTHHKGFLTHFLLNASKVDYVSRVILFGSCARGQAQERSDIDLLVITDNDISIDDEFYVMYDCVPSGDDEFYLPSDVIVDPIGNHERFKGAFGMLQRAVEREGVDLSELLR